MKTHQFVLVRYEADDGKVFDWTEPRYVTDEDGNEIQEHLNAKVLFIGGNDIIENYIEVDEEGSTSELTTPEYALEADYLAALAELGVE